MMIVTIMGRYVHVIGVIGVGTLYCIGSSK